MFLVVQGNSLLPRARYPRCPTALVNKKVYNFTFQTFMIRMIRRFTATAFVKLTFFRDDLKNLYMLHGYMCGNSGTSIRFIDNKVHPAMNTEYKTDFTVERNF